MEANRCLHMGDVAVMYAGQIIERGSAEKVIYYPKHPYTKGLIASHPSGAMKPIPGFSPSLIHIPNGCRFHPRCKISHDLCMREEPPLYEAAPGHWVRCNRCLL
ncbi:MAG: hypothetical protein CVV03_00520 [Firmicutes bacterium HGW-Firmicutes-8]|nr:MAG: hypothetical protein CVV03_00520 [Firmicutes bacterium HGW-Firmicutes-8]